MPSPQTPGPITANAGTGTNGTPPGTGRGAPPGPLGSASRLGPHLLMSGEQAMRVVSQIMPTASTVVVPSNLGPVELRPGTVWSNEKMLVYPSWHEVYYTIGDRLYSMGTAAFLRSEWLNALAAGGARAAWLIPIAKAEMALLTGIFVPWYLLLAVTCAKVTAIYLEHTKQFKLAYEHGGKALGALNRLRKDHPTLFKKILLKIGWETLSNLPAGVRGEDIGFFLGRVIRGLQAMPELTLAVIAKKILAVAALVAATHLPNVAAHAAEDAARGRAEEFRKRLRDAGYTVTADEAKLILKEAMTSGNLEQTLNELEEACKALAPSLETLEKSLYE